jgi:molybdopterin molybdotransferase
MTLLDPRWDDARQALARAVRPLPARATPIAGCDGLVLAQELIALIPLPSFDTSAMDGWAVAGPGPWTLEGASLAGRPVPGPIDAGRAVVIATGGVVPAGADAVIRTEDGRVEDRAGTHVLVAPAPSAGTYVRPAGEECARGEVLAAAGARVGPALIGLAAAAGHDELMVIPRPRAALVLFGDELAASGIPAPGLVRDSLGPQVPAWLDRMGVTVIAVERSEDTLDAHVEAIRRAATVADVVITTGGTASGPVDHLHTAIAACGGEVVVDRVAVRPGHPMLAARVPATGAPAQPGARGRRAWLVGLPGNPQSAIVTLVSLAAPILAGLAGRRAVPDLAEFLSAEAIGAPAHEDRLVLGSVREGTFHPGSHLGSGMLRGLAAATGFAVLPPGGVTAGAAVRWLPLPP